MPSEVEQAARRANAYARSFINACSNAVSFADQTLERQKEINAQVDKVQDSIRENVQSNPEISLTLQGNVDAFYASTYFSKENQAGNCNEYADLVLEHMVEHEPGIRTENYRMEGGNHAFSVINRAYDSDPADPMTWGDDAYVCDSWADKVYPASQCTQHLENYLGMEPILGEERKEALYEPYDPAIHTLAPHPEITSDNPEIANSQQHVDGLVDFFKQKADAAQKTLSTFREALTDTKDRMEAESRKGELADKKRQIVEDKINQIDESLQGLQQDVDASALTRDGYARLKSELENKLQTAKDATNFSEDDLTTLDTHQTRKGNFFGYLAGKADAWASRASNTEMDALTNQARPKSSRDLRDASAKAAESHTRMGDLRPLSDSPTPKSSKEELTQEMDNLPASQASKPESPAPSGPEPTPDEPDSSKPKL